MKIRNIIDKHDQYKINKILKQVNHFAPQMAELTDRKLQKKTIEFKARLRQGATLDQLLPEAFAAIREAAKRVLGMYPYDVQVIGGIIMHEGNIAEMKTGEGKTLTAIMPLYLNALNEQSTILVTPNEYLAKRDAEQMRPVYEFMGLTLGCRAGKEQSELKPAKKRAIYQKDIVYTTNSTLGFDYLIDNLAENEAKKFMPKLHYVIIDEADAILLDFAQTPLIISGAPRVQSNMYELVDDFVQTLSEDKEYKMDEKRESVWMTSEGMKEARRYFGIDDLYDGTHTELVKHTKLALRAHTLFENGKEYVVHQGKVKLLDEKDGRILEMTKLQGGQHQALEAKEHVKITQNMRAMASITYQNFFKLFYKTAGMSGTAKTAEDELLDVYHMKVIQVPTNSPVKRVDLKDEVYVTLPEKLRASMKMVKSLHKKGQPVLIATGSVEMSELYSEMLLAEMIPHNVLNAYNDAKEARIIKEAGQKGSVTVATLMAGRGTDIKLGEGVKELGGLAVIGTEKLQNERMELQLRGRSGRQGDPGFSKFFVSLEDEVVQKNSGQRIEKFWHKHKNSPSFKPLGSKYRRIVKTAQELSDSTAKKQRSMTLAFDESVGVQRQKIYQTRDELIFQPTKDFKVLDLITKNVDEFLTKKELTVEKLERYIFDNITYDANFSKDSLNDLSTARQTIMKLIEENLAQKEALLKDNERIQEFYHLCLLKAIDTSWIEEVDTLEQLKQLVPARTTAQRDPVYEYHFEAKRAYEAMQKQFQKLVLQNILLSTITVKKDGRLDVYFA